MKKLFSPILVCFMIASTQLYAQKQTLPYLELPAPPENYSAGTVAARMVDGLGFRFYWATEGLRPQDLDFKPGPEARTTRETVVHIYSMSFIIVNATTHTVTTTPDSNIPFEELRARTLQNLKTASDNLRVSSDADMKKNVALLKRGDQTIERAFWYLLNGPIADCLWHTGQIVSFRRSSGNPFNEKVNLFTGTVN